MAKKFLDETGIGILWKKIKSVFAKKGESQPCNGQINAEHGNEFNIYNSNTKYAVLNYRGGVDTLKIYNGATTGYGNLYAGNIYLNDKKVATEEQVNNKLGKSEPADSCKSAIDNVSQERLEFTYQRELSDLTWFAAWQRNASNKNIPELSTISKDNVKRVLGINDLATKADEAVSTANSANTTASNANAKAQQAINQINSINQDKITKDDLVFSLSGSTLTITKRY